jgi:hypothetical protein
MDLCQVRWRITETEILLGDCSRGQIRLIVDFALNPAFRGVGVLTCQAVTREEKEYWRRSVFRHTGIDKEQERKRRGARGVKY